MDGWAKLAPALVLALVLAGPAACKKEPAPAEKARDSAPESSASIQAKWDEMVPKPDDPWKLPASWTEPKVIEALAKSCEYAPSRYVPDGVTDLSPNRFVCRAGFRVPAADAGRDLCRPYEAACETHCQEGCASCDKACVDACTTCVKPCGDDRDCKKGCATKCAECNEACTAAWESCHGTTCAKEHDACVARLAAKCRAKCSARTPVPPSLTACLDKCAYVVSPEHEMCEVKCYETAPCGPPPICKD
jgi:hypothetical protein